MLYNLSKSSKVKKLLLYTKYHANEMTLNDVNDIFGLSAEKSQDLSNEMSLTLSNAIDKVSKKS